jgi:hypothetical protein
MYMQRTTSGAAGNGQHTTIKYMRGAASIGLGITIKHLRRATSGAAGSVLGATMKYLRRTTSAAANNSLSTTITPPLLIYTPRCQMLARRPKLPLAVLGYSALHR